MTSFIGTAKKWYRAEIRYLTALQPVLLLLLRLYFGWGFIKAGLGKLEHVEVQAGFFKGYGIPLPTLSVYLASTTECVCGLLLLLGAASRIVTIPLIFTMLIAYLTAHPAEWHAFWGNTGLFLKAPPFLYLLTSILVLLFGPGRFSVDGLLQWLYFGDKETGEDTCAQGGGKAELARSSTP